MVRALVITGGTLLPGCLAHHQSTSHSGVLDSALAQAACWPALVFTTVSCEPITAEQEFLQPIVKLRTHNKASWSQTRQAALSQWLAGKQSGWCSLSLQLYSSCVPVTTAMMMSSSWTSETSRRRPRSRDIWHQHRHRGEAGSEAVTSHMWSSDLIVRWWWC